LGSSLVCFHDGLDESPIHYTLMLFVGLDLFFAPDNRQQSFVTTAARACLDELKTRRARVRGHLVQLVDPQAHLHHVVTCTSTTKLARFWRSGSEQYAILLLVYMVVFGIRDLAATDRRCSSSCFSSWRSACGTEYARCSGGKVGGRARLNEVAGHCSL
jgi:hypothetical protein